MSSLRDGAILVAVIVLLFVVGFFALQNVRSLAAVAAARDNLLAEIEETREHYRRTPSDCETSVSRWIDRSVALQEAVDLLELEPGYSPEVFLDRARQTIRDLRTARESIDYACDDE